jgi:hypothetical protein
MQKGIVYGSYNWINDQKDSSIKPYIKQVLIILPFYYINGTSASPLFLPFPAVGTVANRKARIAESAAKLYYTGFWQKWRLTCFKACPRGMGLESAFFRVTSHEKEISCPLVRFSLLQRH